MTTTEIQAEIQTPEAQPGPDPDVSPAKALFTGEIASRNLFPYPVKGAGDEAVLEMVLDSVRRYLEDHAGQFGAWDREGSLPEDFIRGLRDLGLFGLIIPEVYGGIGLSSAAYARVMEEASRYDSSTALTIGAHSSIGMKGLLLFGNEEQKKRYLPRLASGEMIAAFCLTESGAGSDAASIQTRATLNDDGSWNLSGEKIWITNGGIADFYTVFARTDMGRGKLSAFIVEKEWPGVSTGPKEDKMGIRASSTTTVAFDEVRVPPENLLGEPGQGFKMAMAILNNGRTGLGGGSVGGMKTCIALASEQATERKQFGQPIAQYGLIKEKITAMTVDCFATESVVGMVAHFIDSGCDDYSTEAAIGKVFASEAMWRTAYQAQQIAAGTGYMRDLPYEQILRDSRILTIFEGTSEILRLYIALAGMKEAGGLLAELREAVDEIFNSPIKGFGVLTDYAGRRLTQMTTLGRDRIVDCVPQELNDEALIFEKYALELARATDILLRRHGKRIIDRQFALQRTADVVIDLFVGLCVLSRVSAMAQEKQPGYEQAIDVARLFSQQAKRRMNQNLRRILRNEDETTKAIADHVCEELGYPW